MTDVEHTRGCRGAALVAGCHHDRYAESHRIVGCLAQDAVGVVARPAVKHLASSQTQIRHFGPPANRLLEPRDNRSGRSRTGCSQILDVDEVGSIGDAVEDCVVAGHSARDVSAVLSWDAHRLTYGLHLVDHSAG